ncbi:MAG: hypothetical protein J0L77_07060 [Alphaproteobacteria bacterium]|nr:hypothetical protein [Alphaproteobacteria bacterium]
MKTFLLALMMALTSFIPAMAADNGHAHSNDWLKPAEAQYVCMMNNKVFDKPQIKIDVEGKTYYGCCSMCADKLKNDASLRMATDPVSGKPVDKASAIIGADTHGMTYYFESKENFDKFASGPMPEMKHEPMHEMGMKDGMMMQESPKESAPSPKNNESHQQHH